MAGIVRDWRVGLVASFADLFHPVGDPPAARAWPEVGEGWLDLLQRACVRIRTAVRADGGTSSSRRSKRSTGRCACIGKAPWGGKPMPWSRALSTWPRPALLAPVKSVAARVGCMAPAGSRRAAQRTRKGASKSRSNRICRTCTSRNELSAAGAKCVAGATTGRPTALSISILPALDSRSGDMTQARDWHR
jgi:hypothetical protein